MARAEYDSRPTEGRPFSIRPAQRRSWLGQAAHSPIALVLSIKVLLFVFAWQAYQVLAYRDFGWYAIWNRWDAKIYLALAHDGYAASGPQRLWIVFYPLYPWLVRFCERAIGNPILAAMLVSAVASIAVAVIFERLVRLDYSRRIAWQTVWFLFIFPTSYFLHIGYTESLFLALALGAFLAARTRFWLIAGALSALACLTRVNGLLLLPALSLEAWEQYRVSRRIDPRWLWLGLTGLGIAGYIWLNFYVTGDCFAFLDFAKAGWAKSLAPPWVGMTDLLEGVKIRPPGESIMLSVEELLFLGLGLGGVVCSWIWLRLSYSVWVTTNWLLIASTSFSSGAPRYTLVLFPLFILFARGTAKVPIARVILTVWSLLFLGLFSTKFVLNHWAF